MQCHSFNNIVNVDLDSNPAKRQRRSNKGDEMNSLSSEHFGNILFGAQHREPRIPGIFRSLE